MNSKEQIVEAIGVLAEWAGGPRIFLIDETTDPLGYDRKLLGFKSKSGKHGQIIAFKDGEIVPYYLNPTSNSIEES